MLTVGERIPEFDLNAVVSIQPDKAFARVTHESNSGKWKVLFFWPKDFTFVCPTEIAGFGMLDHNEGVALRATFIVDPEGVIRFVSVNSKLARWAKEALYS
ncbi:MAG: hypothetical protein A3I01_01870 [Betaproteobacteria bacterium RIFCSPLOWO2_02_FULL_65_24]|nr:MAG: hypothetical protein A3I01_01870 [Betaproteobacteria bacterium RIFCSPLOWO2_02_FULL_65_24]